MSEYSPYTNKSYQTFLKEQHKKGYCQRPLSSKEMTDLLSHYFLNENMSIIRIELIEEDEFLAAEITDLINLCNYDKEHLKTLMERLYHVCKYDSIDLRNIVLIQRLTSNPLQAIYLQSNGIVGFSGSSIDYEKDKLIQLISLNGGDIH